VNDSRKDKDMIPNCFKWSAAIFFAAFGISGYGYNLENLPEADVEKGGVTYDFEAASARIFKPVSLSTNCFSGVEWKTYSSRVHLVPKDLSEDSPIRLAVRENAAAWTIRGNSVRLTCGDHLLGLCGNDPKVAGRVVSECCLFAELPDAEGGEYLLRLRYKCGNALPGARETYWSIGFTDKVVDRGIERTWHSLPDCDNLVHDYAFRHSVPKGKRAVRFAIEFSGVGGIEVFEASFAKPAPPQEPVSIRNAIPNMIDGTFALSEGQCGFFVCGWRDNDGAKRDPALYRIALDLPKGVSLAACNFAELNAFEQTHNPDGGESWQLKVRPGMGRFMPNAPPKGSFSRWNPFVMFLKPVAGVGDAGQGRVRVLHDGKLVSNEISVTFKVIPKILAEAPKRLLSGANVGIGMFDFRDQAAVEDGAKLFADSGMRSLHWPKWLSPDGCDEVMIPAMRKAGFTCLMPHDYSLCDGYLIGFSEQRPEDEKFVSDIDEVHCNRAVCPISVYKEMPYFMNDTLPRLRRIAKGCDGIWANWEPYFFAGHGCWCDKCREAFVAYSGLDAGTVKEAWPKEMKVKGRYEDRYIAFRASEHAKVVRTVDKWVREATGGKSSQGFVPGIAWCEMARAWRTDIDAKRGHRYCREQSTREYSGSLEWISPWGPYPRWDINECYAYSKSRPLVYWVAAKDVREQLERDFPDGKCPKLMAYPHAMQGNVWLTQPENLAMAYDSFYFNGWRSVVAYYFPRGYDARYWKSVADATTRAAKYEDWLIDGKRSDDQVETVTVQEFATSCAKVTHYVPAATNVVALQTAAFDLKGTRIVAALNFWEKGEAFFDLKTQGLRGEIAVIDEDGILYAKDTKHPFWSVEELAARGVRLAVGASRTKVFEFRPASRETLAAAKGVITSARMETIFRSRRDRLAEEAEKDATVEKARRLAGCHPPET